VRERIEMKNIVETIVQFLHCIGARQKSVPLLLLAFASLFVPSAAKGSPNHLAGSGSAYLRRASQQAVDWYPWASEAWERAQQLDRPVLLDLGAVWCEWCELMDRESYNRRDVAAFINANFVAVKVDYDAQPQLAAELERAQAVLNLPSGLPITGFMTPGRKLYFGGTYFPPEAKAGKPAFEDVLKQALRVYRERRSEVERDGVDLKREK
jgi:uncharacterized protein YyaL (SSP411 family)